MVVAGGWAGGEICCGGVEAGAPAGRVPAGWALAGGGPAGWVWGWVWAWVPPDAAPAADEWWWPAEGMGERGAQAEGGRRRAPGGPQRHPASPGEPLVTAAGRVISWQWHVVTLLLAMTMVRSLGHPLLARSKPAR